MKVVFAGTPEFAAVALKALFEAGFDIGLVLTQPDRPAGRGKLLQASAVKQLAQELSIPVLQPQSLRLGGAHGDAASDVHDQLVQIRPDVMVVVAYGQILPLSVLQIPRFGCINIHASLLPRWRGAAPIQRAIEAGDKTTGITIMQMDEGLDTGPILLQEAMDILHDDTAQTLHDKLALMGSRLICDALFGLKNRSADFVAQPQDANSATYAHKITKAEAFLDFSLPAAILADKVRAFSPFPGAQFAFGETTIKVWRATALSEFSPESAGKIISADAKNGVLVACGQGILRIEEMQKPGGRRLNASEFIQGFSFGDIDSGW